MNKDYKELGLKVGLEIHQQLDTKNKLFCSCKNKLEEEILYEVIRKLRPTESELGEVDPAALMEFKRNRYYVYQAVKEASCLVELDEEPPHSINEEAIEIATICALLLNSNILEEIHVMRKEVIDGSNTTGFQRTALLALGGFIYDGKEKIGIQSITVEEDASRKIYEDHEKVVYRLDRQGIPLIEIATNPDISDPEQAKRVAYKIGLILRSTGKVKRGLGTIRQDINLSIKQGSKVEIKGVQELGLIPKVIEYEVLRQIKLLELKKILNENKIPKLKLEYLDITELLHNTSSKIIKSKIEKGGKVFLLPLKHMHGLLKFEINPNRRFASELADYVRAWTSLEGIIHSDELPSYGISEHEVELMYSFAKLEKGKDAFIIVAGEEEKCKEAIKVLVDRINYAFEGIPEETRVAHVDGTTRYARPRPGAARMYPETDIPPYIITQDFIEKIKQKLPSTIEDRLVFLQKNYGLNPQLAQELIDSQFEDIFEKAVQIGIKSSLAATVITQLTKYLKRSGINIDNLTDKHFLEIFTALKEGKITKEAIEPILKFFTQNPSVDIDYAIKKLGLEILDRSQIEKIVENVIKERYNDLIKDKNKAFDLAMKIIMSNVRGKADASLVAEILKSKISSILSS
ncbi:MAG: Glu-tRNA(Gln) amidotransferase subunit GatE [Thermoproteota archaeon]|nr:Glu-tRNA(Gln) amidotransferase subunit GatE [Thermoproteota archaeon]